MTDPALQDFSGHGATSCGTSNFPKSFRYLDFGMTSFNFRFIGINKKYLLIIKKFITRFNYNFWLLINWLFITLNVMAYKSFKVTKNFKNKLTSSYAFVYPCAPVPYIVKNEFYKLPADNATF